MACELSTGDELLLTELVFNNFFTDLDEAQTAALLSVLVFNPPKSKDGKQPPRLRDELEWSLGEMKEMARKVGTVLKEAKVEIDVQEYVDKIQPGLAEVLYQWASGKSFRDVCDLTKEFEGTIIRCVRRLKELLAQLSAAAKGIGAEELDKHFERTSAKIARDIVFAPSLYL